MIVIAQGMVTDAWSYVYVSYAIPWIFFSGYSLYLYSRSRENS